jgi:hypothetical protein
MNKKWFILSVLFASSLCFASEKIQVVIMCRLQQLWHSNYQATPDEIENALRPGMTTNIILRTEHNGMHPREFLDSVFENDKGNLFMSSMRVLRYQEKTTNYTIIASFRLSNYSNTNFVSQLESGDIIFFHGHVD